MTNKIMFRFKNLNNKFSGYSNLYSSAVNTFQFINLAKHDIYPHFNHAIMRDTPTTLIVNSGKLLVSLYNAKLQKEISLFAEDNCLSQLNQEQEYNNLQTNNKKFISYYEQNLAINNNNNKKVLNSDSIIHTNERYALYIYPGIFYYIYSYDNTNFQIMFNSNKTIDYYIFNSNNKYFLTGAEYLK